MLQDAGGETRNQYCSSDPGHQQIGDTCSDGCQEDGVLDQTVADAEEDIEQGVFSLGEPSFLDVLDDQPRAVNQAEGYSYQQGECGGSGKAKPFHGAFQGFGDSVQEVGLPDELQRNQQGKDDTGNF